jgi:hypothetical protein
MTVLKRPFPWADPLPQIYFFDHFIASAINARVWTVGLGVGCTSTIPNPNIGGQFLLHGAAANAVLLNHNNIYTAAKAQYFMITWRAKLLSLTNTSMFCGFGGSAMTFNGGSVDYDASISSNWLIRSRLAGAQSSTTTAVAADTKWHEFTVSLEPSIARYWLDGVSLGTLATNLPTVSLQPFFSLNLGANTGATDALIDWVEMIGVRL